MKSSDDVLRKILEAVEQTKEKELVCDEVFNVLGEYTEAAARGEAAKDFMPLVQQHLDLCRDCFEEYDALLNVLRSELSDLM
jgi:hypothetical protein